uniref:Pectinesterase inhibitor domain-containing protein n=1 Tax=Oryza rufipogon TaxID=4529 RepID=A0A0E0QFR9_ORYRU
MAAVFLVLLIAINVVCLSPQGATAAPEGELHKLNLELPPPLPPGKEPSTEAYRFTQQVCDFGTSTFTEQMIGARCYDVLIPYGEDENINNCGSFFAIGETFSDTTNSTLYALERLTAAGEGKRSKEDLETVHKWTKNLETQYDETASKCKLGDLFKYGDKKVPTVWVIDLLTTTAIRLLNAIKP